MWEGRLAGARKTMDSIVHFEIPADNVERAQTFYGKAFGWVVNPIPGMNYTILRTTASDKDGMPTKPGAINGGLTKRQAPVAQVVITVAVPDIDAALKNIQKLGGSVVDKKRAVGDMGFSAYFKDTEGNVIGLWQNPG